MKKIVTLLLMSVILLTSCADKKTIDGVTYRPYGLLNEETCKNDSIQYRVSGWAFASGVVFCELLVPPIYVFGYNLWEPVGKKSDYQTKNIKGIVK
jgi:hypothetical protein